MLDASAYGLRYSASYFPSASIWVIRNQVRIFVKIITKQAFINMQFALFDNIG